MNKNESSAAEETAAAEIFPDGIDPDEAPVESSQEDGVAAVPALPSVSGRALVDIPRLDLRCGQYGTVPVAELAALVAAGEFDPAAVDPAA